MTEERVNMREQRTKGRGRWRRGADGAFHYHGRCPFNNAMCRMLNRLAGAGRGH